MDKEKREYTFAQTFPTGTHAMWIYYWLAANGINPFNDAKTITVPPPQMVANMRVGNMDGFCVGEPWGNRAIVDGIGFTAETTQDDLEGPSGEDARHHRGIRHRRYPNTARADDRGDARCRRSWIDVIAAEPQEDGRDRRRQVVRQLPASTRSTSASWAATTTASARPGTTPTT